VLVLLRKIGEKWGLAPWRKLAYHQEKTVPPRCLSPFFALIPLFPFSPFFLFTQRLAADG
jgi:hypothetical protein